ncbi:MAG: tetratricopeptide repeat protein, partial [Pseudomonadota bacterium]
MSDNSFIREVDDAVRQERYKALWDRYGIYVVGLALALIIGAVSYNAWVYYEESRATSAGDDFIAALDMERAGDQAKAAESLEALA